MQVCKRCKQSGVPFYESNKSWCKECVRERARESREARIDDVREYDRARGRTRKRKVAAKRYAKTEAGKAAASAAKDRWKARNPEKRKAQVAVGNAIRDGKLIRQPCEDCGAKKSQAHHDDYSKPLDVRWKCARCHAKHHREERGN